MCTQSDDKLTQPSPLLEDLPCNTNEVNPGVLLLSNPRILLSLAVRSQLDAGFLLLSASFLAWALWILSGAMYTPIVRSWMTCWVRLMPRLVPFLELLIKRETSQFNIWIHTVFLKSATRLNIVFMEGSRAVYQQAETFQSELMRVVGDNILLAVINLLLHKQGHSVRSAQDIMAHVIIALSMPFLIAPARWLYKCHGMRKRKRAAQSSNAESSARDPFSSKEKVTALNSQDLASEALLFQSSDATPEPGSHQASRGQCSSHERQNGRALVWQDAAALRQQLAQHSEPSEEARQAWHAGAALRQQLAERQQQVDMQVRAARAAAATLLAGPHAAHSVPQQQEQQEQHEISSIAAGQHPPQQQQKQLHGCVVGEAGKPRVFEAPSLADPTQDTRIKQEPPEQDQVPAYSRAKRSMLKQAPRSDATALALSVSRDIVRQRPLVYQPMDTFGRVSIKIPKAEPDDLKERWLHNVCQAVSSVSSDMHVVFGYVRRGCVQITLDMETQAAGSGATAACLPLTQLLGTPANLLQLLLPAGHAALQPGPGGVDAMRMQSDLVPPLPRTLPTDSVLPDGSGTTAGVSAAIPPPADGAAGMSLDAPADILFVLPIAVAVVSEVSEQAAGGSGQLQASSEEDAELQVCVSAVMPQQHVLVARMAGTHLRVSVQVPSEKIAASTEDNNGSEEAAKLTVRMQVPHKPGLVLLEISDMQAGLLGGSAPMLAVPNHDLAEELNTTLGALQRTVPPDERFTVNNFVRDLGRWMQHVQQIRDGQSAASALPVPEINAAAPAPAEVGVSQPGTLDERARGIALRMSWPLLTFCLSAPLPSWVRYIADTLVDVLLVPAAAVLSATSAADWGSSSASQQQQQQQEEAPDDLSLLHEAARSGNVPSLLALCGWSTQRGVAVPWGQAGPLGITPLHLAAVLEDQGAMPLAALSLGGAAAAQAWISCCSHDGLTPADAASQLGQAWLNEEAARLLEVEPQPPRQKQRAAGVKSRARTRSPLAAAAATVAKDAATPPTNVAASQQEQHVTLASCSSGRRLFYVTLFGFDDRVLEGEYVVYQAGSNLPMDRFYSIMSGLMATVATSKEVRAGASWNDLMGPIVYALLCSLPAIISLSSKRQYSAMRTPAIAASQLGQAALFASMSLGWMPLVNAFKQVILTKGDMVVICLWKPLGTQVTVKWAALLNFVATLSRAVVVSNVRFHGQLLTGTLYVAALHLLSLLVSTLLDLRTRRSFIRARVASSDPSAQKQAGKARQSFNSPQQLVDSAGGSRTSNSNSNQPEVGSERVSMAEDNVPGSNNHLKVD